MTVHRLFRTLDQCLEIGLPFVMDEGARHEALRFHRGIKSVLATIVYEEAPKSNVIDFQDQLLVRRVHKAIAEGRNNQIADAKIVVQSYIDDFGWPEHDDIA